MTGIFLLACNEKTMPEGNKGMPSVDEKASNTSPSPTAKSPTSKKTVSTNMTKGLKCVKSMGSIVTTEHIGLIKRGGKTVTAVRTEKSSPQGSTSIFPSSFAFDDGKKTELFMWYKEKKGGMRMPDLASGYPPAEIEMTLQIMSRTRGKCTDWKVDPEFLALPQGNFKAKLDQVVDKMSQSK